MLAFLVKVRVIYNFKKLKYVMNYLREGYIVSELVNELVSEKLLGWRLYNGLEVSLILSAIIRS